MVHAAGQVKTPAGREYFLHGSCRNTVSTLVKPSARTAEALLWFKEQSQLLLKLFLLSVLVTVV